MQVKELVILLPCHSLEDFPIYLDGPQAAGLLASWSAPWHPKLIAESDGTPRWQRADDPPEDLAGRLLFVPQASHSLLRAGWTSRVESEGGVALVGLDDRQELVRRALESAGPTQDVDPELVADFHALGFLFLQIELLTRQMRYMSNIDEIHFQAETLRAAQSAVAGDEKEARRHLNQCFEILTEARERFYPVETYLLDLTLLAETTLGGALERELEQEQPVNLLMSGSVLSKLDNSANHLVDRIVARLDDNSLSVIGGEYEEGELPLMPLEDVLAEFKKGESVYERHLGRHPTVFGRRRFGLTPMLPLVLSRLGYRGALHFTLDEGRFPRAEQSRIQWEGLDGSIIDAVSRLPLDVARHDTFLRLPSKLGEAMDTDYVATLIFAHWPGRSAPWYDDIRRGHRYAPVLGKFVTADEYFRQTDAPGATSRFRADDYRSPYLQQNIVRELKNPLSIAADRVNTDAARCSLKALDCFSSLLSPTAMAVGNRSGRSSIVAAREESGPTDPTSNQHDPAAGERSATEGVTRDARTSQLRSAADQLASLVSGSNSAESGYLALNPHCAPCTFPVADVTEIRDAVPDIPNVPGCGFAWSDLKSMQPPTKRRGRGSKPLAEDNVLRNDFFEILIDPDTGAIRSLHDNRHRGNRLSQQIALRQPVPGRRRSDAWSADDVEADYSVMAASELRVARCDALVGEIHVAGRLLDRQGNRLAGFRQITRVERKSRILEIEIELDIDQQPTGDPWENYYAARFAWHDEAAPLRRSLHGMAVDTETARIQATRFIQVGSPPLSTTILTGGLPYHRRIELRKLDTLLVVRGEQRRRFRLAVAIDERHPAPVAQRMLSAWQPVVRRGKPPGNQQGWFFHIDAPSVVATDWEPLRDEGRVSGCRIRLLETSGRSARAQLRCLRPLAAARQLDFSGRPITDLAFRDDGVSIPLSAYEWADVELRFAE